MCIYVCKLFTENLIYDLLFCVSLLRGAFCRFVTHFDGCSFTEIRPAADKEFIQIF